jgi:pyruvate dehydrogenase E1 component
VRGNGKMIQELEAAFRGAGWNVLKVIWGGDWDELSAPRHHRPAGKAHGRSGGRRVPDLHQPDGAYIRKNFFGKYPELLDLVSHLSDDQLMKLRRGGHDPKKVYNAYKAAVETTGQPTLILAHTIKGYGLGEAGEGRNISHQQKKLNEQEMLHFRSRFEIPIPEEAVHNASFCRPPADSPEIGYMHERRRQLGGYIPFRKPAPGKLVAPPLDLFQGIAGRFGRARSFQHHGVRPRADHAHEASRTGQACGAHHPRRGAHLRHGEPVPPVRHLRQPGPAL